MNTYNQPPQFQSQQPYAPQSAGGDDWSDWDSVEATPERTLIPKGDYKTALEVVNQETVKSGDNMGKPRYNCQFTITDDRQHGRKVFIDFMPHSEISRTQVKALALATNTALAGNMYQVLIAAMDKDFIGNVGVRKDKTGEYDDQNTIWAFKSLQAGTAHSPVQAYQPPAQPIRPADAVLGSDGVSWWVMRDGNWIQC